MMHGAAGTAETTYYQDGNGVAITSARAIFWNRTFAMSNISSVTSYRQDPDRTWPTLMIVAGLVVGLLLCIWVLAAILAGDVMPILMSLVTTLVLGGAPVIGGIVWWNSLKPKYVIRLSASGGEVDALWSEDLQYAQSVLGALNEAMIQRASWGR